MSSDSAMTVPFQEAVVTEPMVPRPAASCRTAWCGGRGSPARCSPAQGTDAPGLRSVARSAVRPGHQLQGCRRAAALGALDGLLRPGPRLADLLRALLVDGPVAPAGASQMCFRAVSRPGGDGEPPVGMSCPGRHYSHTRAMGRKILCPPVDQGEGRSTSV